MKAHIDKNRPFDYVAHNQYGLSAKEWYAVREITAQLVNEKLNDLANRLALLFCVAMIVFGLKARTINKILDIYQDFVQKKYVSLLEDNIADFWAYDKCREYGLNVKLTEEER